MYPVMNTAGLNDAIERLAADIEELIQSKDLHRSGLVLVGIASLVINFNRYTPSTGSRYIDLPTGIKNKKKGVC